MSRKLRVVSGETSYPLRFTPYVKSWRIGKAVLRMEIKKTPKDDTRPDPEALLKEVQREEAKRGRLKIFLGYAPGVGKTYTMLNEAHVLKNCVFAEASREVFHHDDRFFFRDFQDYPLPPSEIRI